MWLNGVTDLFLTKNATELNIPQSRGVTNLDYNLYLIPDDEGKVGPGVRGAWEKKYLEVVEPLEP